MSHKLEVIHYILIFPCWVFLELFKFGVENVPVDRKLRLVLITLTFDFILQFSKSVSLLVLVKL